MRWEMGAIDRGALLRVQGSQGGMPRGHISMMDLALADASGGNSAGILESISQLDETWPMEERGDSESQKCEGIGSEGCGGVRGGAGSGAAAADKQVWHGNRHAKLGDLCAVPTST